MRKRTLRWRDRAGTIIGETGFTGTYSSARISPDGKRAVVEKNGDNDIGTDLWALEFDRKLETRLTTHPDQDIGPVWSPDGQTIIFSSGRAGLYDLFTVSADGGKPEEPFLGDELHFDKFAEAFTRDGRSLLIEVQERETSRNIYVVDMATRVATPLLKTEAYEGPRAVSPDGEWLAYASGQSGRNEVYIQRLDGTGRRIQISTEGSGSAFWFGEEILYWSNSALWSVRVTLQNDTATVSSPVKLRDAIKEVWSWNTVDGQRFLTVDNLAEEPDREAIQVLVNWKMERR